MEKKGKFLIISALILILLLGLSISYLPFLASESFGPSSNELGLIKQYRYAIELLWNTDILSIPAGLSTPEVQFEVEEGESVSAISDHLQVLGLVQNSHLFQVYLIWTGLDKTVQAGKYTLSNTMNSLEIAAELQDSTPGEIVFIVLAGWRMEEIAASLPTSGFDIEPDQFLLVVRNLSVSPDYLPTGSSGEGFLFPGTYLLPRETNADDLVSVLFQNSSLYISPEMIQQFHDQGLDVFQAVTLASIVEREAIISDEKAMIASVFLNRLHIKMKLESDPTVQYALGYDDVGKTWWKNPLTGLDLSLDSPYNTYLYPGLPPGPISNPDLLSLQAVANPSVSNFLFFRARCDGSDLHTFAETFEQHLTNACE
ncbi:endolytic transglycosylase MltG [Chloroflexota bacterium]